jgi:ADP-ribose pyrophosphatase YjhB (NUDIX family)
MQTTDNAQFHIVLVNGVLEKDGKYLLGRRSPKELQAGGEWALPGGKVEKRSDNENDILIRTLKEEFLEEVGVVIDDDPIIVGNESFTRNDNAHVVVITFLCSIKSGKPKPLEDTEEVAWMDYEEVEKNCKPYIVERIKKAKKYLSQ